MKQVRTRFPPSPTGIPHIGTTRTALFNFLFARHNNGLFFLRIEDTDRARLVPESEGAIIEILTWLGILWDGEVVKQSDRLDIYHKHAQTLKEKNLLYEDNGAWRFKMTQMGKTEWTDMVGNKHIIIENKNQEDFVCIKSDGFPTYNFANVIDDHLMEITHVIRGDEYISSMPKYIQLYDSLGWEKPHFVHLPVIVGPDHQKLSKRHEAKSVLDYREEGYLKEALLNYMVLLGWNPGGDREILSIWEMIKLFDLADINTASPMFDAQKLQWMNGEYIRQSQKSPLRQGFEGQAKVKSQIYDFYKDDREVLEFLEKNKEHEDLILKLAQTRMKTLKDFKSLVLEEESRAYTDQEKDIAKKLAKRLTTIFEKEWNEENLLQVLKQFTKDENTSMKTVYFVITGKDQGLPLLETMVQLKGREKILEYLKNL